MSEVGIYLLGFATPFAVAILCYCVDVLAIKIQEHFTNRIKQLKEKKK